MDKQQVIFRAPRAQLWLESMIIEWRDSSQQILAGWFRSREGRLWHLSRIGVTFLLVLSRTIIPPLISALGIKFFTIKTGSLKNKNMSINHESRTLVVI